MANYTTPMFCLPFNLTGTGHCRITFAGSSDGGGNVNFDMSTGDLFANRDYTRADNVAATGVPRPTPPSPPRTRPAPAPSRRRSLSAAT